MNQAYICSFTLNEAMRSLDERSTEAVRRAIQNVSLGFPLSLFIAVTSRCNYDCKAWCEYAKSFSYPRKEGPQSYAFLYEKEPVVVSFVGGEPFLPQAKLEERVREASEWGIPFIQVATNGSYLNAEDPLHMERLRHLHASGLHRLNISLDSLSDFHNRNRGHPHAKERVLGFLQYLRDDTSFKSLSIGLQTVFTRHNFREFPDILELARHYGITVSLNPFSPQRVKNHDPVVFGEDIEEAVALLSRCFHDYADVLLIPRALQPEVINYLRTGSYGSQCLAGVAFAYVNVDGQVQYCSDVPHSVQPTLDALKATAPSNQCRACATQCRVLTEGAFHALVPLLSTRDLRIPVEIIGHDLAYSLRSLSSEHPYLSSFMQVIKPYLPLPL